MSLTSRRSQPPLTPSVPLSRFTSRVGGGSAFYVRHLCRFCFMSDFPKDRIETLIKQMQDLHGSGVADRHQRPIMAIIHGIIAEEQSKSAQRLEQQTATL